MIVDLVTSCSYRENTPFIQCSIDLFLYSIEKNIPYIRKIYIYVDGEGEKPEVKYCQGKVKFMDFPMPRASRCHGWQTMFPYQTALDTTDADCLFACHIDIFLQEDPKLIIDKILSENVVAASDVVDIEPGNLPKSWIYCPQPSSSWMIINVQKWRELELYFSDRDMMRYFPDKRLWEGSVFGFDRGNLILLIWHIHLIKEKWWFCRLDMHHYARWFYILKMMMHLHNPKDNDEEWLHDCLYRLDDHLGSISQFCDDYKSVFGEAPKNLPLANFRKRYDELNILPDLEQNETKTGQKKCFIFATAGLGEVVVETSVMKEFNKRGYNVYLVIQKPIESAFRLLSYLKEVIPLDSDKDFCFSQPGDIVHLSPVSIEEIKKRAKEEDEIIFVSFNGIFEEETVLSFNKYNVKYCGSFNNFEKYHRIDGPPSSHDYFASKAGINLSEFSIDVAFPQYNITLLNNGKKNIGIGIGTDGLKSRRIHSDTLNNIINELSDYNVYVFGLGADKIKLKKTNCIDLSSEIKNSDTLITSLNYLKNMDIFITPDSGFMHCCLAMNVPIVFLQSTAIPELTIHPNKYHLVTRYKPKELTCNKDCLACFHDEFLPERENLEISWRGRLDEKRWSQTPHDPRELKCYIEQNESVQCLTRVNVIWIKETVDRIIGTDKQTW